MPCMILFLLLEIIKACNTIVNVQEPWCIDKE